MNANTTRRSTAESDDALLRFTLRANAVATGLIGVAGIPITGWLSEISGTTTTYEYAFGAMFIVYGLVVYVLSGLDDVRRPGIGVITFNLLYPVAAVALVMIRVMPFTTTGIAIMLTGGAFAALMASLQLIGLRRLRA
jgi:hypothetical protein